LALPLTNKPLTAKPFERAVSSYCGWCSVSCGLIAYLNGDELADLYGHPADPDGVGSLCSKGIAYNYLHASPFRVTRPLVREGSSFRPVDGREVKRRLEQLLSKKVAVFLDRYFTLEEYALARSLGEVYSEVTYLPFNRTSDRPRLWREKKLVINLGVEPVSSEVMLARWLVDAAEKGAYLFSVGHRVGSLFQKARRFELRKPDDAVELFLNLLEGEGKEGRLLKELGPQALLLISQSYLESPFGNLLLNAVKRAVELYGCSYAFVGHFSPLPVKPLSAFVDELEQYEVLLLFGNPLTYLPDEKLELLKGKTLISVSYFPDFTALKSDIILPREAKGEKAVTNRGVGFLAFSPPFLKPRVPSLLPEPPKEAVRELVRSLGVEPERLEREGKVFYELPPVTEFSFPEEKTVRSELWVVKEELLLEQLGRWFTRLLPLEPERPLYAAPKTAPRLKPYFPEVREDACSAEGVLLVSPAYEESQPFNPSTRPGALPGRPGWRVAPLELE